MTNEDKNSASIESCGNHVESNDAEMKGLAGESLGNEKDSGEPMDIDKIGQGQGEELKANEKDKETKSTGLSEEVTESSAPKCTTNSNEEQEQLSLTASKADPLIVEHPFARPLQKVSTFVLQCITQGKTDKLTSENVRLLLLLFLVSYVTVLIFSIFPSLKFCWETWLLIEIRL